MHPVLGKIQFKSFEGMFDVHGTRRMVAYVGQDGDDQSVFAIRGLSVEDAIHILGRLEGGLLKGKDAAQSEQLTLPHTNGVKKEEKPKTKLAVVETEPEDVDDEDDSDEDDSDEDDSDDTSAVFSTVDIAALSKMEKLRPVIELMVSRGFKTSKAIIEVSVQIKNKVPALMEIDKKGNFESRIDRAAMVVLGHE